MSSSTYLTVPGWVETPSTRCILDEIQNTHYKHAFIAAVASMSYHGVSPAEIEAYYRAAPMESIPGHYLNHQRDPQPQTVFMADLPIRSQRSGDSRRIGADEGRSHSNRGSQSGKLHPIS